MDVNSTGVDINNASLEELTGLPGLKQKIAERIIAQRPYETIDDLRRVRNLPAGLLVSLRPLLSVSPVVETFADKADAEEMVSEGSPAPESILVEAEAAPAAETPVETPLETAEAEEMVSEGAPVPEPILVEAEAAPAVEMPVETPLETAEAEEMVSEGSPVVESLAAGAPPVTEHVVEPAPALSEPDEGDPMTPVTPTDAPVGEPTAAAPRPLSTGRMIGCGALMCLAALVLSVAVTLLLLLAINGSLSFATYNQYAALGRQVEDLSSQVSGIQQDVTAMQGRLAAMETLSGRVGSLETSQQTLATNLQTSQQQLDAAQTQLKQLNDRTTQIEQRSQAFSQFIEGLRSLISQIPTTQP